MSGANDILEMRSKRESSIGKLNPFVELKKVGRAPREIPKSISPDFRGAYRLASLKFPRGQSSYPETSFQWPGFKGVTLDNIEREQQSKAV